jgi:hypothetical protein
LFAAVVRVSGAGRLADFRERLRWLMVRDPDAEDYTEHHTEAALEYRFAPKKGIPFPAFTEASREFPELRVEAEWEHEGERGRALIENGSLIEHSSAEAAAPGVEVEVGEEAKLILALVCEQGAGYAASAERHTYFRYRDGKLELTDDPDAALEELAFAFVEEWLWYDEEEAALERARYANYGYPVRGANLRAEKLSLLRERGGRLSTLDSAAREARDALVSQWLNGR